MSERDRVLEIINSSDKRLTRKLEKAGLWDWILSQVPESEKLVSEKSSELIYLALNPDQSLLCKYGNRKYFISIKAGCSERCKDLSCQCHIDWRVSESWQNRSKIAKEKRLNTFKEKWNVDNPSQHPDIQAKKIVTNNINLGCDWAPQNKKVQEKMRNSCFENNGVYFNLQLPSVREALQNYRDEHLDELLKKTNDTNMERYGVLWTGQTSLVQEKVSETCLKRYGVKWTTQ